MMRHEVSAVWRLFTFNWVAVAVLAAALALGLALSGFSLRPQPMLLPVGVAAGFACLAYVHVALAGRDDTRPALMFGSLAQIVMIPALVTPLTYVAAGTALPLQDANLDALDRMIGFDWRAYFDFFNSRPALGAVLAHGYMMIRWQVVAVPLLLIALRLGGRAQRFTLALALTLMATTLLSILVPAYGGYHVLGLSPDVSLHEPVGYLDQIRNLPAVRDGSLRELDLTQLRGIIAFPSFHAAAAILYVWALWGVWWLRAPAAIINGAMLASTPVIGGHYLIDVLAGSGIAVLAIAAAGRIGALLTAPRMELAPGTMPGALAPAE